jgi:tetratricopeptide (TPR) repeat protein
VQECENLIRAGRGAEVARRLAAIKPGDVPRESRKTLASVCRRAGLIPLGLKILSFVVHPEQQSLAHPQPAELAEYGALLYRLGAIPEALRLLENVDPSEAPEALLYQAFCYFAQWEYKEAIPCLESYLRAPVTRYSALVGCVNICAALIGTGRLDKARELLESNLEYTRHGEFWRLHGNCLELSAQLHIQSGEFSRARRALLDAAVLMRHQRSSDQLFIAKWQAVLDGHEKGTADSLRRFSGEARRRGEWESVREADLYTLKFDFDENKFNHLIFGTPFPSYRVRVMNLLGRKPAAAFFYYGDSASPGLNLAASPGDGVVALKPASGPHRVLEVLLRDFYRPASVGALFSALYPGELFDVLTSQERIRQLLRLTRQWLRQNHVPVGLNFRHGGYKLRLDGEFHFRLPLDHESPQNFRTYWRRLEEATRGRPYFTSHEGRWLLGFTPTSFKRLIRWAIEQNLVSRQGGGSNAIYRLKNVS